MTFFPIDFNLDAYKEILHKAQIWISMNVTIIITLVGTFIELILTRFCGIWGFQQMICRERKVLSSIILFTMYFNGGIIPTFMVVKGLGMYDSLTALLVIPQVINVFNFIVMRTFFCQLPESLEEAAKIDGVFSDMQILVKIILPLSVPIIATIGLFYAVQYWNGYFDALLYIQSPDKYTLQLRLRSLLFADELNSAGEAVGTKIL